MEIIILIIFIATLIFWVWTLIDILTSKFKGNEKIVWLIAVLFLNLFGAFLYLIIGRGEKIKIE
jgi:hypothetical protein